MLRAVLNSWKTVSKFMPFATYTRGFSGRIVMLGCGAVGQGVLPLLLRELDLGPERMAILAADNAGQTIAASYGIPFHIAALTPENHRATLARHLQPGDFLLNLSVDVASSDLIVWCQANGVLYLDTGLESWPGVDSDTSRPIVERTTHAQRKIVRRLGGPGTPTALVMHGANPGLVSHLAREALLQLAADLGKSAVPAVPRDWAQLACELGIRTIHIAEHDTQRAALARAADEFVNTWSVAGLIGEGLQPAELGWGSHERLQPVDAHELLTDAGPALCLEREGLAIRVRTWTPSGGPLDGLLITHAEALTLADFLTLPGDSPGQAIYRPTVHYAYHPCAETLASIGAMADNEWSPLPRSRVLKEEIVAGHDELGVLLMGHARGAFWYGSRLGIDTARSLAPHNNATSLQVAAAVLAGVIWTMENPLQGVAEPEDVDHRRAMDIMRPYLGDIVGVYSDWTPLGSRAASGLTDDPWQFRNFRID